MSKVTVVGAGNVGATCANVIATREIASEVVLIDIKEGVAEGKVMDIMQTAQLLHFDTKMKGVTNDYSQTADSDMVVITSGIPRKPGMTREELIGVNAGIVKSVVEQVLKYSPKATLLMVANPMDPLAYMVHKITKLPKNKIIGMSGALDSSRFKYFLSQKLNCNSNDVDGLVIGIHGDTTMLPLTRFATYKGIPVSNYLSAEELEQISHDTMVGGATLTGLLGTSAWMAPGASCASIVDAVLNDKKKLIPCSALMEGEYGYKDVMMGVPCIIGKDGIERIIEFPLNAEEKAKLDASRDAVAKTIATLKEIKVL